jgi:formylglycine-generating enzyme required for sulfatase activity
MRLSTPGILALVAVAVLSSGQSNAQKLLPFKLPDTGQNSGYTATQGEDADFIINPPSFTDNGDGTITDNTTGLMWQKTDGGEMTWENASAFCKNLALGGYRDWRLPKSHELFSINNFDNLNPALNTVYFTKTSAEYWWTSDTRADDTTRIWVVNAGGGIGAHPKAETISAGGVKRFHVRAVRNPFATIFSVPHYTDNGNGTITDNYTGLTWQKIQSAITMTWEEALAYSKTLTLAGKSDWRVPNIRELQSLNDEQKLSPSLNKTYFTNVLPGNYWSSTTLTSTVSKAWDLNTEYGIVSYDDKSLKQNVLLVRGGFDNKDLNISEVQIPGGSFEMGDHFNFVDPSHPSDETPVHSVKVNSFYLGTTETTNQQFLAFLNSSLSKGLVEVRTNIVYGAGGSDVYAYTYQYAPYYSIGYDGKVFSIVDFRANHPVVGVMWSGAAAYCNWLSVQNGLAQCYDLKTGVCDFAKNGYRLPTEAEWEYAGRGGKYNPYFIYPAGNAIDVAGANLPGSGDPYETVSYPNTTPVGFYDGTLRLKSDFNWPGSAVSYQTSNAANGFGLYDMQGNVWEFVNDWYGQNYYSVSPYDNPKGPDSGFIMPDGKPYRGMRGGNWYNGLVTNGVNDGHSRVANRNPSYYRGPQDPNHPWYHVGFRVARNSSTATGLHEKQNVPDRFELFQNYPNPFNPTTAIGYQLSAISLVRLKIYDALGREVATLVDAEKPAGSHTVFWNAQNFPSGVYLCRIVAGDHMESNKMLLMK